MRESVFNYINGVLKGEGANALLEHQTLSQSHLDSFGYVLLWLALESKYGTVFTMEDVAMFEYDTLTLKEIIDRICDVQNNAS